MHTVILQTTNGKGLEVKMSNIVSAASTEHKAIDKIIFFSAFY